MSESDTNQKKRKKMPKSIQDLESIADALLREEFESRISKNRESEMVIS